MKLKKNDIIRLEITGMTSQGSGVGRYDGIAIFVSASAIGDEIDARIIKTSKNYAIGKIENIITPAKSRITPDCPVFNSCGGCTYRHIAYSEELKIKRQKVLDAVTRIGGLDGEIVGEIIGSQECDGYRNKAQLPIGIDRNGNYTAGFYAFHSHRIIDSESCLLQPPIFARVCDVFRKWCNIFKPSVYNELTHKGLLRHLYIRYGEVSGEVMVCLVINGEKTEGEQQLADMLKDEVDGFKSLVINTNQEKTNVILGDKCRIAYGSEYITDELCGLKFNLSPLSFYQVNRTQAQRLYGIAAEYAALNGDEILLDLYCGTGTIGLSMAHKARKLIGVEIIPQAIENAKENAKSNGITNAEFICGDAAKAAEQLKRRGETPDVIIVDPPRKGLAAELIDTISCLDPKRVVYVSCDCATLARDIKLFSEQGYYVKRLTPVDLFPRTAHVETVCLMSR
ncbi:MULTISPECIES: 23S rRNA (uracil(1939)-C(5))-methyltransferase RlmD [unclassified Ruminococcus]|uniref:23S rRNA (uracil(1939)-C(5))-methyltransferase RlmD n=1 Tax=unclassified Ruminococcus TaxID=2608920 RepID=UPI00210BC149|nr:MULTISPECIES: 23S rRNA (uracil(1939)-C(5))-methyltransferase RlmD [unclassified Ruminococcus]